MTSIIFLPRKIVKTKGTEHDQITKERKYNLDSLEHESVRKLYIKRLDDKLNTKNSFNSVEEQCNHINNCLLTARYEEIGPYETDKYQRNSYWWDQEIETDIENKRQKYLK